MEEGRGEKWKREKIGEKGKRGEMEEGKNRGEREEGRKGRGEKWKRGEMEEGRNGRGDKDPSFMEELKDCKSLRQVRPNWDLMKLQLSNTLWFMSLILYYPSRIFLWSTNAFWHCLKNIFSGHL